MTFIDGENFTLRAQQLLSSHNWNMGPAEARGLWKKDTFIWLPQHRGTQALAHGHNHLEQHAIRAYYYTSLVGDDPAITNVEEKLWDLGFTARVFKRSKNREKSKGVDIALAKDMLSHAFQGHFEIAVLIAGDGDYSPLVEELKHNGKKVMLAFFSKECGLSDTLRLAADEYTDITQYFLNSWKELNYPLPIVTSAPPT